MTPWTIKELNFENVLPIWQLKLWPGRKSPIESVSAIDEFGSIKPELMKAKPIFLGYYSSTESLEGVVSGFPTSPQAFRSRGLWVSENHRNQGIGGALMNALQKQASELGYQYLWTMARHTSLPFYQKIGFVSIKELHQYEFGPHFICTKSL